MKLNAKPLQLTATIPEINAEGPQALQFCAEWRLDDGEQPTPVDLQITLRHLEQVGGFPPATANYPAGAQQAEPWNFTGGPNGLGVLKIELGSATDPRVIYCDLRNGRYSLGPQTFVRVSAARWCSYVIDTDPAGAAQGFLALAPHSDGSAEYLTYTCVMRPGQTEGGLDIPPGAQWFELYPHDGGTALAKILVSDVGPNYLQVLRDYANASYLPPFSPIPCVVGNRILVEGYSTVVFWVK